MESNMDNRAIIADAFQGWMDGTRSIADMIADDIVWEIVGNSAVSGVYHGKQQLTDEVLAPFGKRFDVRLHPAAIRGMYQDGDTVIVLWDGVGTALDGVPYTNTYAWFMTMREGLATHVVAFFDSIALNELWSRVAPAE